MDRRKISYEKLKNQVIDLVEQKLQKRGIDAEVYGRKKELYSIFRKSELQNFEFEDVYDIIGIRLIIRKTPIKKALKI